MVSLPTQLAQLESAQLVRRAPDEDLSYLFKHALTQDTAYESVLLRKRREIHRQVAQAYEQLYLDRLDELAALLAHHFAEAGDDVKTVDYATRAGDQATRVYANAEAVAHYTKAIDIAKRGIEHSAPLLYLYTRCGRALELAGKFDQALLNYEEMEGLALEKGDRALQLEALMLRATVHSVGGRVIDLPKAQALSFQALALSRELSNRPAEAKIFWNLLLVNRFGNEGPLKAIEYGEQSIAIARELGLREQLALSLKDIGIALILANQFERARRAMAEAETLWRGMDNKPMLADILSGQAFLAWVGGELELGRRVGEEAYALSTSMDDPYGLNTSASFLAAVYRELGDIRKYLNLLEESIQAGEAVGYWSLVWMLRTQLALTLGNLGAFERGVELAQLAAAQIQAGMPGRRLVSLAVIARLSLLQGNLTAAQAALQDVPLASFEEYSLQATQPEGAQMIVMAHAELALEQGDFAHGIQILDDLLASLERANARIFVPDVLHLKARALQGQDREGEAQALLSEGCRQAESMQARYRLMPVLITLSEVERHLGNTAEADRMRAQARTLAEYIADHTPPELRSAFLQMPPMQILMAA